MEQPRASVARGTHPRHWQIMRCRAAIRHIDKACKGKAPVCATFKGYAEARMRLSIHISLCQAHLDGYTVNWKTRCIGA